MPVTVSTTAATTQSLAWWMAVIGFNDNGYGCGEWGCDYGTAPDSVYQLGGGRNGVGHCDYGGKGGCSSRGWLWIGLSVGSLFGHLSPLEYGFATHMLHRINFQLQLAQQFRLPEVGAGKDM